MESTIARTGDAQGVATLFSSEPCRGPHAPPAVRRGDFEVCTSAELKATLLAIFGGDDDDDEDQVTSDVTCGGGPHVSESDTWQLSDSDNWHVGLTPYGQAVADASGPCDLMRKVWGGGPINA